MVDGTASLILRKVLHGLYDDLGPGPPRRYAFRALVLCPGDRADQRGDTARVLTEIRTKLPPHVDRHGNYLADGATIETIWRMGTGGKARDVVVQVAVRSVLRGSLTR